MGGRARPCDDAPLRCGPGPPRGAPTTSQSSLRRSAPARRRSARGGGGEKRRTQRALSVRADQSRPCAARHGPSSSVSSRSNSTTVGCCDPLFAGPAGVPAIVSGAGVHKAAGVAPAWCDAPLRQGGGLGRWRDAETGLGGGQSERPPWHRMTRAVRRIPHIFGQVTRHGVVTAPAPAAAASPAGCRRAALRRSGPPPGLAAPGGPGAPPLWRPGDTTARV